MNAKTRRSAKRTHRSAFSFAEVMFAVIVLGIGFIMVAAIFPVAISQTQSSVSDTAGVSVGRSGSIYIAKMLSEGGKSAVITPPSPAVPAPYGDVTSYAMPTAPPAGGDGLVHTIDGPGSIAPLAAPTRWDRLKGNFISSSDPRFAWIPIGYKMADETGGSLGDVKVPRFAEIYIMAVQAQVRPTLDRLDYDPPATPSGIYTEANLRPKAILGVHIQDNNPTYGQDTVTFSGSDPHEPAIAPGAYILISNDHLTGADAKVANGQYYRLGANLTTNVWELQPGADFTPIRGRGPDGIMGTADDTFLTDIPTADVLIIGKGYNDPSTPTEYSGAAMDVFMLPPIIVQLPVVP